MTTNVPGPRFPLYILGRQMVAVYPYVPIGDNVRISIAIFSYLDRFSFGVTAEMDAAPDLDVLTEGISRGVAGLGALGWRAASRRPMNDGRTEVMRPRWAAWANGGKPTAAENERRRVRLPADAGSTLGPGSAGTLQPPNVSRGRGR